MLVLPLVKRKKLTNSHHFYDHFNVFTNKGGFHNHNTIHELTKTIMNCGYPQRNNCPIIQIDRNRHSSKFEQINIIMLGKLSYKLSMYYVIS